MRRWSKCAPWIVSTRPGSVFGHIPTDHTRGKDTGIDLVIFCPTGGETLNFLDGRERDQVQDSRLGPALMSIRPHPENSHQDLRHALLRGRRSNLSTSRRLHRENAQCEDVAVDSAWRLPD